MEIILSGSEKELSKFIKSSRLHFKRKGISYMNKEDIVIPLTEEEIIEMQNKFDNRTEELNKYPEFKHKLTLESTEEEYSLILSKLETWKDQARVFDERIEELNKYPEFKHKLKLNTNESTYNKIIENLNKWKDKNNID